MTDTLDGNARLTELMRTVLEKNAQLERALESRIVIEQAKGILGERLGVGVEQAFEILRLAARSEHLRLHALAREVVDSRETPPALQRWLARHPGRLAGA